MANFDRLDNLIGPMTYGTADCEICSRILHIADTAANHHFDLQLSQDITNKLTDIAMICDMLVIAAPA